MSFFSKLVKGVGNVVKGVATAATGIVSKLGIPIVSGAAGAVNSLLAGSPSPPAQAQAAAIAQPIPPPPQTAAQAATFGGSATVGGVSVTAKSDTWTLFGATMKIWQWLLIFGGSSVGVILLLFLIFKRRRR